MSNIPTFSDQFLESIAVAFRKRRNALSYFIHDVGLDKVYEAKDGTKLEVLEVHLRFGSSRKSTRMEVRIWHDRVIWMDARTAAKLGWAWSWNYDGRLIGNVSGRQLVEALERSAKSLSHMEVGPTSELTDIWSKFIARGPKEVR